MSKPLRIATRQSPLALWQANFVKAAITARFSDLSVELVPLVTQGDRIVDQSLVDVGGKALFVKALQKALLNHQADIAVHSIKDMSVYPTPDLTIKAITQREDARDVLLSNHYDSLDALPKGAVVGTGSPRRICQLRALRPDLTIKLLRGNVNTRLQKLDHGDYDAIVLAAAGLKRLGLTQRIRYFFNTKQLVPAIGQGALAIECRCDDHSIHKMVDHLHHQITANCVLAEQAINQVLGGDCHTPIGAYATCDNEQFYLQAVVGALDGRLIKKNNSGTVQQSMALAKQLAQQLLDHGAKDLILS